MSADHNPGPTPVSAAAWAQRVGFTLVLLLLVSTTLYRVQPFDISTHLATGRLILETGTVPTTNSFSWTFPDHPLNQQYPLVQVPAYWLVDQLGFGALSLLACAGWVVAALAWMRWSGPIPHVAQHPLLWLVVVVGVQRHAVQRPEILTVVGLGALLLAFDAWRRGHVRALWALPLITWVMVNSHQLFVLGVALQGTFLIHAWLTPRHDGHALLSSETLPPLGPLLVAVAASMGILMVSPLGPGVYLSPLAMIGSLLEHGHTAGTAQSQELRPFWTDPLAAVVVASLSVVVVLELWRTRGRWQLVELAVLAMGLVTVAAALRGTPFFALAAGTVAVRLAHRGEPWLPADSPVAIASAGTAGLFALLLIGVKETAPRAYLAIQTGIGRSHGEWADHTIAFLEQSPPPGRVLNLGWVTGNTLIWARIPPYVDPRWEAYPRDFLHAGMAAMQDGTALAAQIETWRPHWILAEMRLSEVQERAAELLTTRQWHLVYADSHHLVLVHDQPDTQAYLRDHRIEPRTLEPGDWEVDEPVLLAQQQVRVARFLRMVGANDRAQALLQQARSAADHPQVAAALASASE